MSMSPVFVEISRHEVMRKYSLVCILVAVLGGVAALLYWSRPTSIVRTIQLGQFPQALAVDAYTGRAVVTDAGIDGKTGRLITIDVATGTMSRAISLPGLPSGLVADTRTGRIFVGYSTRSGTYASMVNGRGAIQQRVLVAPNDETMVFDAQSGDVLVSGFYSPPSYSTTTASGTMRAVTFVLDGWSGQRLRSLVLPGQSIVLAVDGQARRLLVLSTTLSGDGTISVRNVRDGHPILGISLHNIYGVQWALDESSGRAFVAMNNPYPATNGRVLVLDTHRGAVLHMIRVGALASIAVDERLGQLYVLTRGVVRLVARRQGAMVGKCLIPTGVGHLVAIDVHTGTVRYTVPVGINPQQVAVDQRTGHVFVVSTGSGPCVTTTVSGMATGMLSAGKGHLVALDGRSGALLHILDMDGFPSFMAVDAPARRILVVDGGGLMRVADVWGWVPRWLRSWLPLPSPPHAHIRLAPGSVTIIDASGL